MRHSKNNTEVAQVPNGPRLVALPGSARGAVAAWTETSAVPADTGVEVTVVLRRRSALPSLVAAAAIAPEEFAERYGADPADLDLVTAEAARQGVEVLAVHPAARQVRLRGSAETLSGMFGTELRQVNRPGPDGTEIAHRYRTGELSVPAAWDGVVTAVLGLDDRPQASPRFQVAHPRAVSQSYTPPQLGQIYRFPPNTDGAGQTIAIVELGGGYQQSDLDAYFSGLGLRTPSVSAVGVDGAANAPGRDPQGADGEVMLDIEVAGALAPAADIVVYFAPNSDAGFVDAVAQAAHATPTPAAISISWGASEDSWTAQARTALDEAIADAAALGVTVTAAAGDDGSSDRAPDGRAHVDFPASSPHTLGCGGTRLVADTRTGAVTEETVWNNGTGGGATGGGVSAAFPLPAWQNGAGVPARNGAPGQGGRGVPDVAAVADPQTGYQVRVDGSNTVIGGTSAVAPLWAALVARLAQATGQRPGLLAPALYARVRAGVVSQGFRDITTGDNGAYRAGPGWDACTGLGVPVGTDLLTALSQPPAAV
ncbi:MAG: kumamolisin [Pseudonocardiales bacterium]|jgi:kumamolisin|nr:kumamolisin [Pseudonocardiales bacterium]